jgi:hypothetical protein
MIAVSMRRRSAFFLIPALAAWVCAFGLAFGSRAAGGADPFGYVSQADLWSKGDLRIEQPLSREFPWPHPEETLAPLGYRPGEVRHTIVPTYAPGVPIIMAAFSALTGTCGPYFVTPVFGALLILSTFALTYRLTHSLLTGFVATLLMAGSPTFLFNLMFPMSDIVAAALWTTGLALLAWPSLIAAAAAGCASGLAIVARPNLVPLALALAAAALTWTHDGGIRRRSVRVATFSIGVIAGSLFVAYVNQLLYGSPLASGYGDTSILYSLSYLGTNLVRYSEWLLGSESWLVIVALLPFVSLARARQKWTRAVPLALFAAIVCASYVVYRPFEEWWFLRFLLPAFPILFIAEAVALRSIVARLRTPSRHIALTAILALLMLYRGWFANSKGLLRIGPDEERYVAVGQYVDRALPSNAVVLSMQHSGSIRYYSGRLTLRYDLLSPTRLPFVIDWFRARGLRPYIVLDDSEEAAFRHHFATASAEARLEMRVLAEMTTPVGVRLYDPEPHAGVMPPADPIVLRKSRACVPPSGPWAR